MVPTLLVGDYLFVSKFSYGYSRYSLPFGVSLFSGRVFFEEPKRGDVTVFKLPTNNSVDYIKRIVGLPGDTIQLKKSVLHINGKPVKREKVEDFIDRDAFGNYTRTSRYRETFSNGRSHYNLEFTENTIFDTTLVYTVPEGHYFVMGDNRDRSKDSRFLKEVGFIPRQNLVGRADFLFFSVNGTVWKIWKWFQTVRFERFFQEIE
jgi:signal peptidase I